MTPRRTALSQVTVDDGDEAAILSQKLHPEDTYLDPHAFRDAGRGAVGVCLGPGLQRQCPGRHPMSVSYLSVAVFGFAAFVVVALVALTLLTSSAISDRANTVGGIP